MSALRVTKMYDEPQQPVVCWSVLFKIKVLLKIDLFWEIHRVVEFDLGKSLQIENQPLQMNEQNLRQVIKLPKLMNLVDLFVAIHAEIITNNLGLNHLIQTFDYCRLILDLKR